MTKYNVVIDTDPGIDDAVALLLALNSPELNILGITSVAGNVPVEKALRNVLRIIGYVGRSNVRVYGGAYRPLLGEIMEDTERNGYDGLGDVNISLTKDVRYEDIPAAQFLIQISKEYPRDIVILTLGPLTNIALSILLDQEFQDRVKFLVSMLGCYGLTRYALGTISSRVEFNAYVDPLAAKVVIGSEIDKYLIGLDVTQKRDALFFTTDFKRLSTLGRLGKLVTLMYRNIRKPTPIHDPMVITYLIKPEIFRFEKYYVDVEVEGDISRGETIVDNRRDIPEWLRIGSLANICIDVNGRRYKEVIFERLGE